MENLARKLMMIDGERTVLNLPSAIFGTANTLAQNIDVNRSNIRIGLWPCVYSNNSEVAMGLMAVLGLLLDKWQDVLVYRIFAQVDGDINNYQWTPTHSQFNTETWTIEGLDYNAIITSNLRRDDTQYILKLCVSGELIDESEHEITYRAASLSDLIGQMLDIARDVATKLGSEKIKVTSNTYTQCTGDEEAISTFLTQLFRWELRLYLALCGQEWSDTALNAQKDTLLTAMKDLRGDCPAWSVAGEFARTMMPGWSVLGEVLVSSVAQILQYIKAVDSAVVQLALGLYGLGYVQEAYTLLEDQVDVGNELDKAHTWLNLATLYRNSRRHADAIDTFQRAIEEDAVNSDLYVSYANLLLVLSYEHYVLEDFILIDPDEYDSDWILWEAVEAYEEALQLEPDRTNILYTQLLYMMSLDEGRFIDGFKVLLEQDNTGDLIRHTVDNLHPIEGIDSVIALLTSAIDAKPERKDLPVALAAAYLIDERQSEAAILLQQARETANDPDEIMDIERLMLTANDPEFETRMGEIEGILSAGNPISTEDVEFLEAAIETAPSFADGYILLGKAYLNWGEDAAALDILLDGQKLIQNDPDILELLGKVLWDTGEKELAFKYLNQGLREFTSHVPLLATTAQLLFDNGQVEDAKPYLVRAEQVNPRHPALNRVRKYIADNMDSA